MSANLKLYRVASWLFALAAVVALIDGQITLALAFVAVAVATHSYAYTDPDRRRARHRRPRR